MVLVRVEEPPCGACTRERLAVARLAPLGKVEGARPRADAGAHAREAGHWTNERLAYSPARHHHSSSVMSWRWQWTEAETAAMFGRRVGHLHCG